MAGGLVRILKFFGPCCVQNTSVCQSAGGGIKSVTDDHSFKHGSFSI